MASARTIFFLMSRVTRQEINQFTSDALQKQSRSIHSFTQKNIILCKYSFRHGRRKNFFQGEPVGDFPKSFSKRGLKVVKFGFYPSKLKKQPFFANNFKIQGGQGPPLTPMVFSTAFNCTTLVLTGIPNKITNLRLLIEPDLLNLSPQLYRHSQE